LYYFPNILISIIIFYDSKIAKRIIYNLKIRDKKYWQLIILMIILW